MADTKYDRHIIEKPRGMVHCPLTFKRVDKLLLLVHTSIAPKYLKVGEEG